MYRAKALSRVQIPVSPPYDKMEPTLVGSFLLPKNRLIAKYHASFDFHLTDTDKSGIFSIRDCFLSGIT